MEKQKPKWYRDSMKRKAEQESLALFDRVMKDPDDPTEDLTPDEFFLEYHRLKKIREGDFSEVEA